MQTGDLGKIRSQPRVSCSRSGSGTPPEVRRDLASDKGRTVVGAARRSCGAVAGALVHQRSRGVDGMEEEARGEVRPEPAVAMAAPGGGGRR